MTKKKNEFTDEIEEISEEQPNEEISEEQPNEEISEEQPNGNEGIDYEPEIVQSGAEYWNFEEEPVFIGKFINAFIPDDGDKAGEEIGFNFTRYVVKNNKLHKTDDIWIISNSYAIEKSLKNETPKSDGEALMDCNVILKISYLGKGEASSGRSFNKFKVEAFWPK